jgi:hypothetical protein
VTQRPTDTPDSPSKLNARDWIVRVPLGSVRAELTDRQFRLMFALDGTAGGDAFCWAGNAYLQELTGRPIRVIQEILDELEGHGKHPCVPPWIVRVWTAEGRPGRDGIILLRRLTPNFPIARNEEEIRACIKALRERPRKGAKRAESRTHRRRKTPQEGCGKSHAHECGNSHAPECGKSHAPECGKLHTELDQGNQSAFSNESAVSESALFRRRGRRSADGSSSTPRELKGRALDRAMREELAMQGIAAPAPPSPLSADVEPFQG